MKRLKERFESENEGKEFDTEGEPVITPLLKAADGGIPHILEALRAHDNDDARDFVELYDSLSQKDKQYLTLEEIAVGAGIGSLRLAEVAQSAVIMHGQMMTNLRIWSSADKIVKKSIKMALTTKGVADREWALKRINYLPMPKGAQINIATQYNGGEREHDEPKQAIYLDPGERLKAIHEAVEQRRLPAPPSEPIAIDGRLDHIQSQTAELLHGEYE